MGWAERRGTPFLEAPRCPRTPRFLGGASRAAPRLGAATRAAQVTLHLPRSPSRVSLSGAPKAGPPRPRCSHLPARRLPALLTPPRPRDRIISTVSGDITLLCGDTIRFRGGGAGQASGAGPPWRAAAPAGPPRHGEPRGRGHRAALASQPDHSEPRRRARPTQKPGQQTARSPAVPAERLGPPQVDSAAEFTSQFDLQGTNQPPGDQPPLARSRDA